MRNLISSFFFLAFLSLIAQHNPKDNFINEYKQFCQANSYNAFLASKKGIEILMARVGDYHSKALKNFNKAIELDSSFCDAYYLAGSMHRILGNPVKAIELAEKSIRLNENYSAYVTLGNAMLLQKEYNQAIQRFDKAIMINSTLIDGYYGKAQAYFGIKRYQEVIAAIEKGKNETENIIGYNKAKVDLLLGKTYFASNDSRAFELLVSVRNKLKNDGEGSYFLGQLYLERGDKKKSSKFIEQAKSLGYNPD
ncbi:tetratricopeptide repeat protein [Ekhidna sp.]